MIVETLCVGQLGCNCVILGDEASGMAMVIDPGGDVPQILLRLADFGMKVQSIVHTHAHIDHIGGTAELVGVTQAPTYLHPEDRALFDAAPLHAAVFGIPPPSPCSIDHDLVEGTQLRLGKDTIDVIHTPGHSPGSVCFVVPSANVCVCGDTLFAGGIGRTDLPGGDFDTLERSIRERLYALPPETDVIPGHGPMTTIEIERQHNPFVRE